MKYYVCWRNYELEGIDCGDVGPFCVGVAVELMVLFREADACGRLKQHADYWLMPA